MLKHGFHGDHLVAIYENGDVYKFDIENGSYELHQKCKHEICWVIVSYVT